MADFSFRKLKRVKQTDKDIVYGYIKGMQSLFSEDNPYYTIVQLIQDLCLLYFHKIMETKILTDDEQEKLIKMVENHTDNKFNGCWKLLFRATRDGFKRDDFFSKCNEKNNTICVIKTKQNNVFGGFTSITWDKAKCVKGSQQEDDPSAFVYLIRSQNGFKPEIIGLLDNNGEAAIQHFSNGYLSFGDYGDAFYFETGDHATWGYVDCGNAVFDFNLDTDVRWNGDTVSMTPTEIEVFQLQSA